MKILALVGVMALASSASAQAPGAEPLPPPPPGPAPAPVTAPAPAPVGLVSDEGVKADANQDHAWYLPTGETVPQGAVVFTDWELLLAGFKWGVAQGVELSAETLVPLTSDFPIFLILGGKLQLLKTDNLRVAGNANLLYFHDTNGSSNDSFSLGMLGGAASLCLDAQCHSLLTGGMQFMFGIDTNNSSSAFVFTPSVSLIGRLGRHVKALVELDGGGYHADGKTELASGALLMYGFRFYSSEIAGDIGFARPVCSSGCDTGSLVLGIPLVTFSYRF